MLVLVACCAGAAPATNPATAPATTRKSGDLQAHGSDDRLWLARVEPLPGGKTPTEITNVYVREKSDATWRRLDTLGTRIAGMANRGSQLAVLLPGGDWRLTTEAGYATGSPLPNGGRIVTIGGDGSTVWAIGFGQPPPAPSTTNPTTNTTSPSFAKNTPVERSVSAPRVPTPTTAPTSNLPPVYTLYRLAPQGWEPQNGWPDEISPGGGDVTLSLGVVGGAPLIAHKRDARDIRIWRRGDAPSSKWEILADVPSDVDVAQFKLLGGTPAPMLWYRGITGPGQLWIAPTRPGGEAVTRALAAPAGGPHAVAFANGAIRELWIDDGKIFEQRLNASTGAPDGPPIPAVLPAVSLWAAVARTTQITLAVALVLALAASMRRRGELAEGELDPSRFRLAPFSRRLIAGAIDAVPIIAAVVVLNVRGPALSQSPDVAALLVASIGVGAYLLLTTVVEVAAGRSIGKMLTGLYIVGLDGRRADVTARLMRNVFRVIDLIVVPLSLILFSPLRQRAGDLAAGTIVVQGPPSPTDAPGDSAADADRPRRRPRRDGGSD